MPTAEELTINTNATAMQMAEEIFGPGVTVVDADYDGDNRAAGIWTGGDNIAPGLTPSDTGVILSTGRVRDITNRSGDPNQNSNTSTNTRGDNNNPDLNALAGANTYDASILDVDFIPDTDLISMQFTFASEEYPEYVGSIFNDVVGVWINGEFVESPIFEVTQISNLNADANETLYVDNTGDAYNTEMDGFTVTLRVLIPVNAGEVNSIRIAIADVGDSSYDSAVLIAGDSLQGEFIAFDDQATVFEGQTAVVDVLANDMAGVMMITQVNGQDITVGGSITLNSGHVVTLLPDGNLSVVPPGSQTGLTGPEEINFTYTAVDADGITDTAFVTITAIPCFARGTMILTPQGERPVEALRVGDLVETRDHGPQPLRWIGSRRVAAEGRFAPVVIEAGTFGHHRRLCVSPQHRVLLTHSMAELLFGEEQVLVAAKDLVNGCSVRIEPGGEVEYFHLLFDQHQIVWSDGLETESFYPGPQTLPGFDAGVQAELVALFPEMDPQTGQGYGRSARPQIKGFEARALFG